VFFHLLPYLYIVNNGNNMDYKKIHDSIIDRAKNRKLEGYVETHHIIPKCMNGTNEPNNLVDLAAREHFLIHWLLHEMYPENSDLRYAFWSMCRNSNNQQRYKPSSRVYEYAKHKMLEIWVKFKPSDKQIIATKESVTGTKWYHKPDGTNLRAFPNDPKIVEEGWLPGRFGGKSISDNANKVKQKKYEGKKLPSTSNKRCSIDGVEFESAKAAADFLNMNEFSIRWILQGRGRSQKHKEKYKNWYYIN
jgi:hypothetical protein